jgi:hypothetical protein
VRSQVRVGAKPQCRCGFSVTAGTAPFLFLGDHLLVVSRISGPIRPRRHSPESRKSCSHAGLRDGETRTRTGDTTIFRSGLRGASGREIPGNKAVSTAVAAPAEYRYLRTFRFVCGMRRLHPTVGRLRCPCARPRRGGWPRSDQRAGWCPARCAVDAAAESLVQAVAQQHEPCRIGGTGGGARLDLDATTSPAACSITRSTSSRPWSRK